MAQESWKLEPVLEQEDTGCQPPEGPILCVNNCGFFGTPATMNMCSSCYRDVVIKATAASVSDKSSVVVVEGLYPEATPTLPDVALAASPSCVNSVGTSASGTPRQQPNRCFACRKRVGLTGFKCRCGDVFCSLHRYSDKHNCSYDYKAAAREAISKANPVVKADKVDRI